MAQEADNSKPILLKGKLSGEFTKANRIPSAVAEASIYFESSSGESFQTQSDSEGNYELTLSEDDRYHTTRYVWVYHPQYNLAFRTLASCMKQNDFNLVRAERKPLVVLLGERRLSGVSVRATGLNYQPLPKALRERLTVNSNADGEVALAGFPGKETGSLVVHTPTLGQQEVEVLGSPIKGIVSNPKPHIKVRGVARITGKVVTDNPKLLEGLKLEFTSLPNISYSLPPEARKEMSRAKGRATVTEFKGDGSFEVPAIAAGQIRIRDSHSPDSEYRIQKPKILSLQLEVGDALQVQLPLKPLVNVLGELRFTNGKPVRNALVSINSDGEFFDCTTDNRGQFSIKLVPDVYKIDVVESRYQSDSGSFLRKQMEQKDEKLFSKVEVPQAKEFRLPTIEMYPERLVKAILSDSEGKPIDSGQVLAFRWDQSGRRRIFTASKVDAEGRLNLALHAPNDDYDYLWDPNIDRFSKIPRPSNESKPAVIVDGAKGLQLRLK
ncbi:MAG: hypothetical protein AAF483_06700 [Planctomycetota bacterium]